MLYFLLLAHLAATAFMTGLIWFVQIVHYPLMAAIPPEDFVEYEHRHVARTGWVVGPTMALEMATAVAVLYILPSQSPLAAPASIGLAMLLAVWLSTALLQVPCHNRLARAHDPCAIQKLVTTNWIRTILWSGRSLIAAWMAWRAAGQGG